MAAMFATFILQIAVRYTARAEWIAEAFPILDPTAMAGRWSSAFCCGSGSSSGAMPLSCANAIT